MKLSGNQKVGALVAAVLPLVASIYGEQAERRQQIQARHEERQARVEADRRESDAADSAAARELNDTFQRMANPPDGQRRAEELCSTLHTSLELLRQNEPTPKIEAVVAAWLTYHDESDGELLVCDCRRALGVAYANWLPEISARTENPGAFRVRKRIPERLLFALTAANSECDTESIVMAAAATPAPASTPWPDSVAAAGPPAEPGATEQRPPPPPPPAPAPASRTPAPPVASVKLTPPAKGARVYFQVPDKTARDRIAFLRTALEAAGYRVHEVEVVGEKRAPSCAELRYVYAKDTPEAETLLDDLNQSPVLSQLYGKPVDAGDQRRFRKERMGRYEGRSLNRVFEVWLPRDGGKGCSK